ncbi:MAG: DUF2085 domain-containing protein [Gracilimonas sp.]|nr:DUF2085 domain-containing protein [Gracilimonas sp.]
MNKTQIHNRGLYFSVAGASVILFVLALGPGLFGSTNTHLLSWQYEGFDLLCHQIPSRSYHLSGISMAVCSRCIGIYGAIMGGWLALPILSKMKITHKSKIGWLIGLIILNLADVFGNFFDMWSNTLNTRFALGAMLGLSVAMLFNNDFFPKK